MVSFWKDVSTKAPHHSRASWMKYYRRHKRELNRAAGDESLPQRPEKKMRYSSNDDVLLAQLFVTKPTGTSDQIFQAFALQVRALFIVYMKSNIKPTSNPAFPSSLEGLAGALQNS